MNQFLTACINCTKPLNPTDKKCDECHHVQITAESLNEKIFLLYLKYLNDHQLSLEAIKTDKLNGYTNFDFELPLEHLDKIKGNTLKKFISQQYPALGKSNFIGLGFLTAIPNEDHQDIEALRRHIIPPIVAKIAATYAEYEKVEPENELLSKFIFLSDLFKQNTAINRLYFTFKSVSNAEFRFYFTSHLKSNQISIAALKPDTSRYEILSVLKEHAFSTATRNLASFIYDLELCRSNIGHYRFFEKEVPKENSNYKLKLFENAAYVERLVQMISYKTYFPMYNADTTKLFRNNLNLKSVAETLRALQGEDPQLDRWIYLICEEVYISHSVVLTEATVPDDEVFAISKAVILDGKLSESQERVVAEEEEYEQLLWLLPGRVVERNLKILAGDRLNVYKLQVLKDMGLGLQKEFEKYEKISFSPQAKKDFIRHFMANDHPNKRLFQQFNTMAGGLGDRYMRMKNFTALLSETESEAGEMVLLLDPEMKEMHLKPIINSLWKRKKINLTRHLLEKISTLGKPVLQDFIRSGPIRADKIADNVEINIEPAFLEFIVEKHGEDVFSFRHLNRFCTVLIAFRDKDPQNQRWLDAAKLSFTKVPVFKPEKFT